VCWFGFNNEYKMLSDLYTGTDSQTRDFRTVVWRMKALGFNAIRVAFNFDTLDKPTGDKPYRMACRDAGAGALFGSVTPPGGAGPTGGGPPPSIPNGVCNDGIPDDSVYRRFLWACDYIASQDMYVLVDWHNSGKADKVGDAGFVSPDDFINRWARLVADLQAMPHTPGKLMIDIMNEPDAYDLKWEPSAGRPGMSDLYLRMMDRVAPTCPDCLFFVEGTGQSNARANWGDGFITDEEIIRENGRVSSAKPFFEVVVTKPYIAQVVLAPHIYCPSSSKAADGYAGGDLYGRLDDSFGGKVSGKGYCNRDGVCHKFAVVLGETSNNFYSGGPAEKQCWDSISTYVNRGPNNGTGVFSGWFYWGWNSNSADTGGLVSSTNPRDIDWSKVDSLRKIGL
jgi:aryl-phospho-beta-D-glucosidase BglC (GH1 family)